MSQFRKVDPPGSSPHIGAVRGTDQNSPEPGWQKWLVMAALCLLSFISAVDATIVTTSLPTITRDLQGASDYVWIADSFLFASTAPQALFGQTANIFGRRNPMLLAIALFALGSGVAGGARDQGMLIAGRVVQGLGTAGLHVLAEIIICDMIPPRQRGTYLSAVLSFAAIGTTVGPVIGGALAQVNWHWVFWINLPASGLSLLAIFLFLNISYERSPDWRSALRRVDFLGNAIFIPSIVSLFFGLIRGGSRDNPWGSIGVVLPLFSECIPPRLFMHRTSAAGYIIIFLSAITLQAVNYFLPIYFQALKGSSPLQSGVNFLPFALAIIPFGGFAGVLMTKTGSYIPMHLFGFSICTIRVGLFSTLTHMSTTAAWVGFQLLASTGIGIVFAVTLPSTLAPLSEPDVPVATGTFSFVRSFGLVWGATMASIVFNSQINKSAHLVDDPAVRALLIDGGAYSFASTTVGAGSSRINALEELIKGQVMKVYESGLKLVWLVLVAVPALGVGVTCIEKHVELRTANTEVTQDSQSINKSKSLEAGLVVVMKDAEAKR